MGIFLLFVNKTKIVWNICLNKRLVFESDEIWKKYNALEHEDNKSFLFFSTKFGNNTKITHKVRKRFGFCCTEGNVLWNYTNLCRVEKSIRLDE